MQKSNRITVRGKQRSDIDPNLFVQLLIAIGRDLADNDAERPSPDAFQSAVEDTEAAT